MFPEVIHHLTEIRPPGQVPVHYTVAGDKKSDLYSSRDHKETYRNKRHYCPCLIFQPVLPLIQFKEKQLIKEDEPEGYPRQYYPRCIDMKILYVTLSPDRCKELSKNKMIKFELF